ncbi:hypothetical protein J2T55_002254 [Methylohalomonas lacus]|uniref:DUF2782 domain-containing protein n=1 Tax=Methylohalomonas lacus TaxID=398773 RepID=A0AAE3HL32_9GAMM|nr:DUF2782 domain-containing protein [Methylohalomonas lacus]MCS3904219.1 hypothetical protein [Methylohalomonas lacus]
MLRTLFALSLALVWHMPALAQTGEVPGMPEDPAMAEPKPPPRVEEEKARQAQQEEQARQRQEAGDDDGAAAVPAPPELPERMESGEPIEPEVTIIQREDAEIEEYRVNGRLYMVKVKPSNGPVYYLVDRDGDGHMESRISGIKDDPIVPQWVIFSW